jgi:hypothetical protein
MERRLLRKIDLYVFLWGVVIILASTLLRDVPIFLGALAGSVLAALNWLGFRWVGTRMAATGNKKRFGIFLGIKTLAILVAVVLVLGTGRVSPVAFLVGLSSLVLGILTRSVHQGLSEGSAALKEEQ